MSTSNLYKLYRTKTTEISGFQNGWGTAPVVWGYLLEVYLKREANSWLFPTQDSQPLWNLVDNPKVPMPLRIVHAFCFNKTICPSDKILQLADACEKTYEITHLHKEDHINNWKLITQVLREKKIDKRCIGIALSCTSISDQWISTNGIQDIKTFDLFRDFNLGC